MFDPGVTAEELALMDEAVETPGVFTDGWSECYTEHPAHVLMKGADMQEAVGFGTLPVDVQVDALKSECDILRERLDCLEAKLGPGYWSKRTEPEAPEIPPLPDHPRFRTAAFVELKEFQDENGGWCSIGDSAIDRYTLESCCAIARCWWDERAAEQESFGNPLYAQGNRETADQWRAYYEARVKRT